jgi:molybdate transport repressor ModE-like protein
MSAESPEMLDSMIERYRSQHPEGKLTCANAYKIAHKLRLSPEEVGRRSRDLEVRITACDLGQFGKQPLGELNESVREELRAQADPEGRITCKAARTLAEKSSLKTVRTAIKNGGPEVIYCQLGCFTEKRRTRFFLKTKSWIENQNGDLLFGKGKTEILEMIRQYGSISAAAEKLGMSYRKAWSHIKILQKNLDDTLVIPRQGGGERGGTTLTPRALEYIDKYRQLQQEIEEFANERFKELFLKPRNRSSMKGRP